jgi:hypothetical protein
MITNSQIRFLAQAVKDADGWRGLLTGNYGDAQSIGEESERLAAHDTHIAECKKALRELRRMLKHGG